MEAKVLKVKVPRQDDRAAVIVALVSSGFKVWIERKDRPGYTEKESWVMFEEVVDGTED